ncbi:hypothetical protein ACT453_17120, partial [Bacillus sp. D-CC]
MYRTLIPAKYRGNITEFDLITDGYDGVVAHVMPSIENPKDWTLSLDTLDSAVNIDEVMKTLIHETAHVLTLGHKQIPDGFQYVQGFQGKTIQTTEWFGFILESEDTVIVAFRGTQTDTDWIIDSLVNQKPYP